MGVRHLHAVMGYVIIHVRCWNSRGPVVLVCSSITLAAVIGDIFINNLRSLTDFASRSATVFAHFIEL